MNDLVALIISTCFAAGLNTSATVATVGLAGRTGMVALPGSLEPLTSWWVIGAALAAFLIEFIADKIPVFDLVWNALQTFIRVPAGAVLAYAAASDLTMGDQLLAAALGGLVAFGAHAGKAAAHVTVNASPEPFSNMVLSLGEDALAIVLAWFATRHPFITAGIVIVLLACIVLTVRWVARALQSLVTVVNPRPTRP